MNRDTIFPTSIQEEQFVQPLITSNSGWEVNFSYLITQGSENATYPLYKAFNGSGDGSGGNAGRLTGDPITFLLYFPDYIKPTSVRMEKCNNSTYGYSSKGCTIYGTNDKVRKTELASSTWEAKDKIWETLTISTNTFYRYLEFNVTPYASTTYQQASFYDIQITGTCLTEGVVDLQDLWVSPSENKYIIKY